MTIDTFKNQKDDNNCHSDHNSVLFVIKEHLPDVAKSGNVERDINFILDTMYWPAQAWQKETRNDWVAETPGMTLVQANLMLQITEARLLGIARKSPMKSVSFLTKHPFWKHYRTGASGGKNCCLHISPRQNMDPAWTEALLECHGDWLREHCGEGTSPVWIGGLESGDPQKVITYLKMFVQHGWLDLGKGSLAVGLFMEETAKRGQVQAMCWAIDTFGIERIDGVERELAKKKTIDGPLKKRNVEDGFKDLEQRWGEPGIDVLTDIWRTIIGATPAPYNIPTKKKSISKRNKILSLLEKIEARIELQHGFTQALKDYLLDKVVAAKRPDILENYVNNGWSFSEEKLNDHRETLSKSTSPYEVEATTSMLSYINNLCLEIIQHQSSQTNQEKPRSVVRF